MKHSFFNALRNETASGTILGVAIVIALLELAVAGTYAIGSVAKDQHLALAAQAGALAAADALNGFTTGFLAKRPRQ